MHVLLSIVGLMILACTATPAEPTPNVDETVEPRAEVTSTPAKPTPNVDETVEPRAEIMAPDRMLPMGVPCQEIVAGEGSISGSTYGGDLVAGWEFKIKHPTGFEGHGCQIVSSKEGHPTRSGRYSLRFEVRDGDCNRNENWDDCSTDRSRHELSQSPGGAYQDHQYEGDDYWYSWSILMPPSPLKKGNAIAFLGQFNSDNAARFYIEDFSEGLGFRFSDETNNIIEQDVLVRNSEIRSQWTDILVHALWSSSDNGLMEVFINGETKWSMAGPNMAGATNTYFDFGIYNAFISECECDAMPTQIVYFDDIRRGMSRKDVETR